MTPLIRHERQRGVDVVWLDSPATKNALSLQMLDDLAEIVGRSADDDARGLVIDHTGSVFCAGVDVRERRLLAEGARNHSEALAELYTRLWSYPKPVLARVAGAVRGGGIGLLVCADAVIATQAASFAFSEVRVGVAPALVGGLAAAKLGAGVLGPHLLTGSAFGPEEALRMGLVTEIASSSETVDAEAESASNSSIGGAAEVSAFIDALPLAAPGATVVTKSLIRRFTSMDVPRLIEEMTSLSAELFAAPEGREGMQAVAERRPPAWVID